MVIDGATVVTGSFNFTKAAEEKNAENLLILRENAELIQRYRLLPDAGPRWRDVWPGALLASGLFILGRFLIGLYLGRASFASAYGAAGSLVVILAWVYWSSQILLYGAAVTRVRADHGVGRPSAAGG